MRRQRQSVHQCGILARNMNLFLYSEVAEELGCKILEKINHDMIRQCNRVHRE